MMKLFLKYNGSYGDYGFEVFDETAYTKYTVSVRTEKNKQQIIIKNLNKQIIAEILNKNIVFRYFSVKCMGRFYILFPVLKEYFAFMIYGSNAETALNSISITKNRKFFRYAVQSVRQCI